jgi:hypothetical protein
MIAISAHTRIWVAREPADFRCGHRWPGEDMPDGVAIRSLLGSAIRFPEPEIEIHKPKSGSCRTSGRGYLFLLREFQLLRSSPFR